MLKILAFEVTRFRSCRFAIQFPTQFQVSSVSPPSSSYHHKPFLVNKVAHISHRTYSIQPKMDPTIKIQTKVIPVTDLTSASFKEAADLIRAGELVAFPTETVYGLGANALEPSATLKIFKAKNRPNDNPLIVHVSDMAMLNRLVTEISPSAQKLIDKFWPGALTILFPKKDSVPIEVTCGQPTVAVRMPSHPVAMKLIKEADRPIAAPSANLSGRPSPTTAQHVLNDLNGRLYCILDGGPCDVGLESTVVDVNRNPPLVLRPGGITLEHLRTVLPEMELYSKSATLDLEDKPPTPGLKYRHYSPNAKLILYEGSSDSMQKNLEADAAQYIAEGLKVALIHTHQSITLTSSLKGLPTVSIGDETHPLEVAKGLFAALRSLDEQGVDLILMEGISEKDEGLAVMNRARKAASQIIHV